MFEVVPLSAFSAFGNLIFCAVKEWNPPPPSRPLRSDGRLSKSVRVEPVDIAEVERAIAAGEDIDAPSTHAGYTALHFAVVRGRADVIERLVAAGADAKRRVDKGNFAIGLAIVHKAPPEVFAVLERAGAELFAPNDDGFTALHAACEIGNAWAVRWLVERKHGLEPRTKRGHTPFQIACALGHVEAAKTLVELGADVNASSPDGVALDIAKREGRTEIVAWLSNRAS